MKTNPLATKGRAVMGYSFTLEGFNRALAKLGENRLLFAPRRYEGQGEFSDADSVRYGEVRTVEEMELEAKSGHSFKEALTPISETLFFFTEDSVREAEADGREAVVFLRSCDLHALRRLDDIYLKNGGEDYYYRRLREKFRPVLLGCARPFESCFCVDMGANVSTDYCASLDVAEGRVLVDCRLAEWEEIFRPYAEETREVVPARVTRTLQQVRLPGDLEAAEVAADGLWDEYDSRCIACGRCNFSCPTCTCFTMQDLFYSDNGRAGERRRVWASCMVDGFTDVAGGGSYRRTYGQRMRFKALHKVLDYKQRFGYPMCVGCGRCDDVCPEYISFARIVDRLGGMGTESGAEEGSVK